MGDLRADLIAAALAEGFVIADTVDVDAVLEDPEGRFASHVAALDRWIDSGAHGEMAYLARGRDRRANPRLVYPAAQSALCVAIPYPAAAAGAKPNETGARYARYLQGPDYHLDLKARLDRAVLRVASGHPGLTGKVCVDTSAVLERTWCALAGLGWIGKNTLLLHPQHGSYLFLAVVFLNQATGRGPTPHPDYCGNCTRCMTGCPTGAITEPRRLDSRKCISYLTLEKRGPPTPEEGRGVGAWVAGCDICQEVCPFNGKPARASAATPGNIPANATQLAHWNALLNETRSQYDARISGSALGRIKWRDFQRNLAVSIRNILAEGSLLASELSQADWDLLARKAADGSAETEDWLRSLWQEILTEVETRRQLGTVPAMRIP